MRVLVTGGAGYIGAHLVVELLLAGHDVVVLDDLSFGHAAAVTRAQELAGRSCIFIHGSIGDAATVTRALNGVSVVFHLAAFKMVDESMAKPERYFQNNLAGMATMIEAMEAMGVRRIVYSSSAAVYGTQAVMPIVETAPLAPENPYGLTKKQGEELLDWMVQRRGWSAVSLRYFNPVGAHPSGRIGQPVEGAAALAPRVLRALLVDKAQVTLFGTDWPTPDGTCLRDYIHVCDLSRAHLVAMGALDDAKHHIFNVGTGRPHSVREVVEACSVAAGRDVPFVEGPRRPGDMYCAVADPSRFRDALGFEAHLDLDAMVRSAWRWGVENPAGYP